MNKYEQLVEYVTNGNDAKAADLFHEIVVAKSRDIYESLMDTEDELGGDQADELINGVRADETGMQNEDEDELAAPEMGGEEDFAPEIGGEEGMDDMGELGAEEGEADLEDRVVDLEDQIEELMAEFNSAMGDEEGMGDEMGGDEFGGEEELGMEPGMDDMGGEEELDMQGRFNEAVSLTKVTKGIANSTESEGTNKKSINADNSGKKGSVAKPHQQVGEEGNVATPTVKPGDGTTEPNESKVAAPKKGEEASIQKKSLTGS